MDHTTVGIDVSKAHLDAHVNPAGRAARFPNDRDGIRRLIQWVGGAPVRCVAYEHTGRWHRPLEAALLRAGLPAAGTNPWRARRFAEATGRLAKTDPVDAAMLADMAAAMDLRRAVAQTAALAGLRELVLARGQLVKNRTAAQNRLGEADHRLVRAQLRRRLAQAGRQVEAVDAAIGEALAAANLARKAEVLCSIPGISQATAACLIGEVPELGSLSPKAAGKPHKVALTAVMRSLLVLANALLAQDRLWAEKAPRQATA